MARGEITAIRDVAMNLADPTTVTHKEVQFRIDGQGPYVVFIPLSEFTGQRARDMVTQRVKEWAEVVGKAIEAK